MLYRIMPVYSMIGRLSNGSAGSARLLLQTGQLPGSRKVISLFTHYIVMSPPVGGAVVIFWAAGVTFLQLFLRIRKVNRGGIYDVND